MEASIHRPSFDSSSLASSRSSSSASTGSSSSASTGSSSSASTGSSRLSEQGSNRSELFWGQFDRITTLPVRKKSFWQVVKQVLSKKKGKGGDDGGRGEQIFTHSDIPTHPEGLYCVIDDFLETYADGEGDFATTTVEEDYAEIVDTYDEVYEPAPKKDFNDSRLFRQVSMKKARVEVEDKDCRKMENCLKGHNMYNPHNSDNYYSLLYNTLYECNQNLK